MFQTLEKGETNMNEKDFEMQSIQIVELLIKHNKMSREHAIKLWFSSKTYNEILKRNLTYISATCAYSELMAELNHNPRWFTGVYM